MTKASRELFHGDPSLIIIPEDRQRKDGLDIGDLIGTIRARGVLMPILVRPDLELIAGWRRLKTALFLNLKEIPYRVVEGDVSDLEIQIIELEENVRRKDLTWQDKAAAVLKIHLLYMVENGEDWTVEQTSMSLNYDPKHLYKMLDLGEAIAEGDKNVIQAETMANATTLLSRRRSRATDEALQRILETKRVSSSSLHKLDGGGGDVLARGVDEPLLGAAGEGGGTSQGGGGLPDTQRDDPPPYAIISADAHEWLANYTGPKFNFLHADLPYGVRLNEQAQQQAFEGGGYESTPDIYFALMDSLLLNWDKFMFPSAHIMWWFSFNFREDTEERISRILKGHDPRIQRIPLIWHKTDNRGILPDPMRGPRNIGEYALLISTGDRKIVKPVSNIYGAPTAKAESIHTNEKPEPMLRQFFTMLVDGHSRVLDPTAGSGSAIRAAESLGAEAALGLEFNLEFAERAQSKLLQARKLKNLSAMIKQEGILNYVQPEET